MKVKTIVPVAASRTATFISPVHNIEGGSVVFYLDVTANTGTNETLNITIQGYDHLSDTYYTIDTFTEATGVTTERKAINALADGFVRLNCVLGGTGSPGFTYTVSYVEKP